MVKELRLEILALSFLLLFPFHPINTKNGAKIEEVQRGAKYNKFRKDQKESQYPQYSAKQLCLHRAVSFGKSNWTKWSRSLTNGDYCFLRCPCPYLLTNHLCLLCCPVASFTHTCLSDASVYSDQVFRSLSAASSLTHV